MTDSDIEVVREAVANADTLRNDRDTVAVFDADGMPIDADGDSDVVLLMDSCRVLDAERLNDKESEFDRLADAKDVPEKLSTSDHVTETGGVLVRDGVTVEEGVSVRVSVVVALSDGDDEGDRLGVACDSVRVIVSELLDEAVDSNVEERVMELCNEPVATEGEPVPDRE